MDCFDFLDNFFGAILMILWIGTGLSVPTSFCWRASSTRRIYHFYPLSILGSLRIAKKLGIFHEYIVNKLLMMKINLDLSAKTNHNSTLRLEPNEMITLVLLSPTGLNVLARGEGPCVRFEV